MSPRRGSGNYLQTWLPRRHVLGRAAQACTAVTVRTGRTKPTESTCGFRAVPGKPLQGPDTPCSPPEALRNSTGSDELRRPGGHGKSELGAATGGASDGDRAAVGLYKALDDEQTEAGPAPALAAPELAEDARNGFRRYALALVAHRHRCSSFTRFDHDTDSTSAVSYPVFHKIGQDLADLVRIEPHLRELTADIDLEAFLRITRGHPARDQSAHRFGKIHHLAAHLQPPGLHTGDVEQIVDEAGPCVGGGFHLLAHEQLPCGSETAPPGEPDRRETFGAGPWCTQRLRALPPQVPATALHPGGGVPQCDDKADEFAFGTSTDVAGGHEYLTLVRQEECPFWLVTPFTRPPVGVTGLPPVVPVGSDQGQDRTVVTTEGGLGGRPDQLSCQ